MTKTREQIEAELKDSEAFEDCIDRLSGYVTAPKAGTYTLSSEGLLNQETGELTPWEKPKHDTHK